MAFKLRSGNKLSFKSMGSSPAKQMTDFSNVTVDGEDAKTVIQRNIKERNKRKKEKEKEMQDLLDNPDQSINRNKHRKEDMMPPPNKQIELALLRKRKGLGPREIKGEDDQSYEAAVTRSEMRMNKEYPYYYKINGQKVSKDAYIKYKNKPGGDESGKQTNDPDVYGKKANNHGRNKKTK